MVRISCLTHPFDRWIRAFWHRPETRWQNEAFLGFCLVGGIYLRVLVYWLLDPFNNDGGGHWQHISYIAQNFALPSSDLGHETWQPPLYYALMAAFYALAPSAKFMQVFSLLFSIGTLVFLLRVIRAPGLFRTATGRRIAGLLAAFQPQLVMFSLYVSNDTMAYFLGSWAIWRWVEIWRQPTRSHLLGLYAILTAGLMTKNHFQVFFLVITGLIGLRIIRAGRVQSVSLRRAFGVVVVAALLVGNVKPVQNLWQLGRPFVCNMDYDPPYLKSHQNTYQGISSILNVNVGKLVVKPTYSESTRHSIPLLFYGTHWYQYIPESNFDGNETWPWKWMGSLLYLAALPISLVMLAGLGVGAWELWQSSAIWRLQMGDLAWLRSGIVVIFLGNVALLLAAFARFDAWDILQARSFYPAFVGLLLLFDLGCRPLKQRRRLLRFVHQSARLLLGLFLIYYATEAGLILVRYLST